MQLERNCLRTKLTGFLAGLVTMGVFLASIGGAIAYLGSAMSWSIMENSQSPLVLDAPARTVAFVRATEKEPGRTATTTVINPAGEVVILDDWNYTAITRGRPQPSPSQ
jgi:hypothetical protein